LNAADDLFTRVALLFSAILEYGFPPEDLCTSTIMPICKGCNVSVTDSASFHGIALSSISVKIFGHTAEISRLLSYI